MDAVQAGSKSNREFSISGTACDTTSKRIAQGIAIVIDSAEIEADD